MHFTVYNPTSTGVMITPQYSINNGQSWKGLSDYPYEFFAAAGTTIQVSIASLPTNVPIMLRIKQTSGSSSEYCFIDDIEISYEATWEPEEPEYILGDVDESGKVTITGGTVTSVSGAAWLVNRRFFADINFFKFSDISFNLVSSLSKTGFNAGFI